MAEPMPAEQAVRAFLQPIVKPGQRLAAALSGGADSVCLLCCLAALYRDTDVQLCAIHVNHQLRGAESDRDERFCADLCERLGIRLYRFRVDVRREAARQHESEETAARRCRYACLHSIPADYILTAHNADDNFETFLHRSVRGAGLHGLTAIPPINGRLLRPLLQVSRAQIETYLSARGQDYVCDSTNAGDAYTRNRIRHQAVPLLQRLNPRLPETSAAMLHSLRRDDAYLTQTARSAFQARAAGEYLHLENLPDAIAIRCIGLFLQMHGCTYDAQLLERLLSLSKTGGKWMPDRHTALYARQQTLILQRQYRQLAHHLPLRMGENRLYEGFVLTAERIKNENSVKIPCVQEKFTYFPIDYGKIEGEIILHGRACAGRIRLAGRSHSSDVKKLIQTCPLPLRSHMHLLSDNRGVFYIEGTGVDERVCPDKRTREILKVEVRTDGKIAARSD